MVRACLEMFIPARPCPDRVSGFQGLKTLKCGRAGYGRKEVAELLLEAGADAGARNADGQRPVDVAEVNREMHMVAYLRARAGADAEPVAAKFL